MTNKPYHPIVESIRKYRATSLTQADDLLAHYGQSKGLEQSDPDPLDPYKPPHSGFFPRTAIIDGQSRQFLIYIPTSLTPSGPGILIFADQGMTAESEMSSKAWNVLAETHQCSLLILEPLVTGWKGDDLGSELSFADAVMASTLTRDLFSVNESTYYVIGQGAGVVPAAVFAIYNNHLIAGVALDGAAKIDDEVLSYLGDLPSGLNANIRKSEVPMPAWLMRRGDEYDNLTAFFKQSGRVGPESLWNGIAMSFREESSRVRISANELQVLQVWTSDEKSLAGFSGDSLAEHYIIFLKRVRRWLSEKTGHLRPARDYKNMGLNRCEEVIDGFRRHWYVYDPTQAGYDPDSQKPLVVALHGYSCTGELFAQNSLWIDIAAERGFYVLFPTAYPGILIDGCCPLPKWRSGGFRDSEKPDDLAFILHIVDQTLANYPIDPSRIFVAGHSNGSSLTQDLMHNCPERFAAFSPVGYTFGDTIGLGTLSDALIKAAAEVQLDATIRPVWYIKGEHDIGSADVRPDNANGRMLRVLCQANGIDPDSQPDLRENGIYQHQIYCTAEAVPLVRFTAIKNFPHAYTPEIARMTWDEFFSHYRRNSDGTIQYSE